MEKSEEKQIKDLDDTKFWFGKYNFSSKKSSLDSLY